MRTFAKQQDEIDEIDEDNDRKSRKAKRQREEEEEEFEEEKIRKKTEAPLPPLPTRRDDEMKVIEREVNLSLINDKLNYVISALTKITEGLELMRN
jgi:hypothetical protein